MKAFKGCIDPECKGYKKVRYKKDDKYCKKCGSELSFVCADCWKPMADESARLCINCEAKRDQMKADRKSALKEGGTKAAKAAAGIAAGVPVVAKGLAGAAKDAKGAVDSLKDIVGMMKK